MTDLPEKLKAEHGTLTFEIDGKQISVITFLPPGLLNEMVRRYNMHKRLVEMLELYVGCEEGETVIPLYKKEAERLVTLGEPK